jgi:hypothetical protein
MAVDVKSKTWTCRAGHVLGIIRWNGDGMPQLMLYRHAVDQIAERPAEVDVIGPLEGRMPVQCDVDGCGDVQVWNVSVATLVGLFERLDDGQVLEFSQRILERSGG